MLCGVELCENKFIMTPRCIGNAINRPKFVNLFSADFDRTFEHVSHSFRMRGRLRSIVWPLPSHGGFVNCDLNFLAQNKSIRQIKRNFPLEIVFFVFVPLMHYFIGHFFFFSPSSGSDDRLRWRSTRWAGVRTRTCTLYWRSCNLLRTEWRNGTRKRT